MKLANRLMPAALFFVWALSGEFSGSAFAQNGAAVVGAGSFAPAPMPVVPGGIMTIFAAGLSPSAVPANAEHTPLPFVLGGISASIHQYGKTLPVPLLAVFSVPTCLNDVSAPCSTLTGIRLQIPFEVVANIPGSAAAPNEPRLVVTDQADTRTAIDLNPFSDRIHVLTIADTMSLLATNNLPPLVTHSDGSLVTAAKPATPGEELVAYAVGLGLTDPLVGAGQPSPSPAPRATTSFVINYDFSPNAAPARGLIPVSPSSPGLSPFPVPVFAGLSPGSVGLYQLNFVVPSPPSGTLPCGGAVSSNLTVSFVGTSLDGAPICIGVP